MTKHLLVPLFLISASALLVSCSTMSSTRQLSPDREPDLPHRLPTADSVAQPVDSLKQP
ncbi:hypothetical protein [Hymenobacter volaticus]|uniref:Uncharacterized protein n=1 Tax=Hymenobacter volaticus TaxID=2932254 RepID=A0ABY4G9C8_9BACT|nr:hypothetical protein [Hymenobacter volaticus]UOQ67515.1 hypothetical protein MUN86_06470 [Hymenobacter volaticus]